MSSIGPECSKSFCTPTKMYWSRLTRRRGFRGHLTVLLVLWVHAVLVSRTSHLSTETRDQYHFFFLRNSSFPSSKGENPRRSEQSETAASDQKSRQWSPASGMPKNQHFRHGEESRHCQPSPDERAYRLRYRSPCSRPGTIHFSL